MASITHGRLFSALRIWFMASLGQSRPLDMIRWSRTSSPNSDMPRILAKGHCLRASRSTLISSGRERPAALVMWLCRKSDTRLLRIARTSVLSGRIESVLSMKITQALLDDLTAQAKASPRLRMNLDLRNSAEDQSQQMLNAIEPGSPLPIHRHCKSSETVVCLRGRLVEEYYDELERTFTETIELRPGGQVVALNIPAGEWHMVKALESGSVILEMKDGAYEPQSPADVLSL